TALTPTPARDPRMTARSANCPNCGAAISFRWSSAVQTTCPYCRSILVRHDVDLERVGTVSDLPETASPIQLGTEGTFGRVAFVVVGRIVYEYERGGWSEWYCVGNGGESLWLSDAQLDYAVSRETTPRAALPAASALRAGEVVETGDLVLRVTTITRARYRGVEGELPFEYWNKDVVPFADLVDEQGRFGTIDYSEVPPLLFVGEYVSFDALQLRNVRQFESWPAP
ncbi:MAG TPA: DUF4178 domain-containing protein, partial [Gemmatimonadaceae bacterium]|nr:DUF4178 domain-containing protein [Gemmatimonadaceae bacterium]